MLADVLLIVKLVDLADPAVLVSQPVVGPRLFQPVVGLRLCQPVVGLMLGQDLADPLLCHPVASMGMVPRHRLVPGLVDPQWIGLVVVVPAWLSWVGLSVCAVWVCERLLLVLCRRIGRCLWYVVVVSSGGV